MQKKEINKLKDKAQKENAQREFYKDKVTTKLKIIMSPKSNLPVSVKTSYFKSTSIY